MVKQRHSVPFAVQHHRAQSVVRQVDVVQAALRVYRAHGTPLSMRHTGDSALMDLYNRDPLHLPVWAAECERSHVELLYSYALGEL